MNASTPEPPPISTAKSTPVFDLVMDDMRARKEAGHLKYGTVLKTNNGRDALMDAYQEAIDLCMYLRQAMAERDGR